MPVKKKRKLNTTSHIGDEQQAIKIQSAIRGYLARKRYHIAQLDESKATNYSVFLVGNDPVITRITQHQDPTHKVAVIGTSGLRAISLALQLGNAVETPKLIIVDNSRIVVEFWRELRDFVQKYHGSEKYFIKKYKSKFLPEMDDKFYHSRPDHQWNVFDAQSSIVYMTHLFKKYGFDHVISLIKHTTVLCQGWENPQLFIKLKNILALHNIPSVYLYASNIAAVNRPQVRDSILANIETFIPKLAIHTDCCCCGMPHTVYRFTNNKAKHVTSTMFGKRVAYSGIYDTSTLTEEPILGKRK